MEKCFKNLNYFGEKEVLFLPFTEFKIVKIRKKKQFNRTINIIILKELGTKNQVTINKMQVINVNDISYMSFHRENQEKKRNRKK